DEAFVRPQGSEAPPHWIPLNVVSDAVSLLGWLRGWQYRDERPDLVERAIALEKAMREYEIPAYVVQSASEDILRVIFKRVNDSGVAMRQSEVFEALFDGAGPHPIQGAIARLQEQTGFGELSPGWFLRCLEVVEDMDVRKSSMEADDEAAVLPPESI